MFYSGKLLQNKIQRSVENKKKVGTIFSTLLGGYVTDETDCIDTRAKGKVNSNM